MRQTDLESDNFKFYLRSMIKEGWVIKTPEGQYCLSTSGKTFANNLNEAARTVQRQPKLSVIIVVSRQVGDGSKEFLLHRRSRVSTDSAPMTPKQTPSLKTGYLP